MIKLLSLFSGIGAFEKALKNLEIPFDLVGYCEIDKYASRSYSKIHGVPETMNFWDVKTLDPNNLGVVDLLTYGFPCQDISQNGNQKGFYNEDGSVTRSGLFFEALRIIEGCKPKIAIAENVKNLVGKRFKKEFEIVLKSLEEVGYNNYWKVLNAKDFGIPQNRERVFIVSIRKDIDNGLFEFPEGYELNKRLKDLLENYVDEQFYLSERMLSYCYNKQKELGNGFRFEPNNGEGIAKTIRSSGEGNKMDSNFVIQPVRLFNIYGDYGTGYGGNVWDVEGLSPTLQTMQGGNRQPFVVVKSNTKKGFDIAEEEEDSINFEHPNSKTRRGRVGHGVAQTLTTSCNQGVLQGRIRKLTPKECFRLMGFDDSDFEKAKSVNSNSQLYKQAGNSIVVDVLEELFCMMFDESGELFV